MLVPLTAIVTSSLPLAAAIAMCAKDRKTMNKNKGKSSKSAKSSKSGKSGKSGSKSKRSGSKSGRSSKKSKKSKKSQKSSKSSKSSKSKDAKKIAVKPCTESKSEKSEASTKTCPSISSEKSCKSKRSKSSDKPIAEPTITRSSKLAVAPSRLQYQPVGGVDTIELKNPSAERKAYKIKCSDNALYRVNPVYGFAEPKSSVKIDVLRLNGENKTDKLVFITANAEKESDAREVFNNGVEQPEMIVVPLVAA